MLMYLYIAIGSAIGGVGRGWLSLTIADATGPEFPWGTIFINIVGSLLIGAFATGTAGDGRFPLSPDARTFLMVGVCGGFTTFSSFSLQTLELLRQGRPGWALLNIGASLLLCLGSVAVGYYGAASLRPAGVSVVGTATDQSAQIVAVLDEPAGVPSLLKASVRLADLRGGGKVQALAIEPPGPQPILPTEEVADPQGDAIAREARAQWAAELHRAVGDWIPRISMPGAKIEWLEAAGSAEAAIRHYGAGADAIVVASRGQAPFGQGRQDLHTALSHAGRTVLVVPPGFEGGFGERIAIAWRDDALVRGAVRAALPLLKTAKSVRFIAVGERPEQDAALKLIAELGISAAFEAVDGRGEEAGVALLDAAHRIDADLMVMGAFSRGEWREDLLGGVTRYMLANADMPILMSHARA